MYFKINDSYVFLTYKEEQSIRQIVLKDKSPEYRGASVFKGTRANAEANKLIQRWVIDNLNNSYIRLIGSDAKENIIDLIYCYSCIYKNCKLLDLRENINQLIPELDENYDPNYPYGKKFALEVYMKPNSIFKLFSSQLNSVIININIDEVLSVYGELTDFKVYTKRFYIHFNENIELC